MKRFFIVLLVFILLASLDGTRAFAVDSEDIYNESGASKLQKTNGEGLWDSLWSSLINALTGSAPKALKYGALIIACLLLISVVNGIRSVQATDISGAAFDFVSAATLAAAAFPAIYSSFVYTRSAVESIHAFCLTLLPVTVSLYSLGGEATAALSAGSGMSMFLTATQTVNGKLLMPLLSVAFAFALLGLLPGAENLAPLGGFVKNCANTLIAFVFSLVGFVFYFQTAIAASADNLAYRSLKFATGSFIPLIGNAVGESSRVVFGAVSAVKASVGTAGLCVVGAYLLPPLICALIYKGVFSFCAMFARLCALDKQARFISELGSLLGTALALLVACGVVFTVISAVFLKSGVQV